MRRLVIILLMIAGPVAGRAQTMIIDWQFSSVRVSEKEFDVKITAEVLSPWHIYSQTSPEGAALPTKITFTKNPLFTLEGKTKETGKLQSKYEEVFEATVKYYEGKVEFVQRIKMKLKAKTHLTGVIEYMLCNDGECLPPKKKDFAVVIN